MSASHRIMENWLSADVLTDSWAVGDDSEPFETSPYTQYIEYEFILIHETQKAVGVSFKDSKEVIWLPKSQITRGFNISTSPEVKYYRVPEWLAFKKGLETGE